MLDVKTLKVLEFLSEHPDKRFSIDEMRKDGIPADFDTLQWMEKHEWYLKGKVMTRKYENWTECLGMLRIFTR